MRQHLGILFRILQLAAFILAVQVLSCHARTTRWRHWSGNKENWRFSNHTCITNANIKNMARLWTVTTAGTVVATPAVCNNFVYYVDWRSNIVKLNLRGEEVWKVNAKEFVKGAGVRVSPALSDDCSALYVTTQWTTGSWLIAVKTSDGSRHFPPVRVHPSDQSRATSSPTFYGGHVYVGVSSTQENSGNCCSFRGALVKVNGATGKIAWTQYTVPKDYSGAAVWGSAPAINADRGEVCVGTGNLYRVPRSVLACLKREREGSAAQRACVPRNVHVGAIVCYKMDSGANTISWRAHGIDIWGDVNGPSIRDEFKDSSYVGARDMGFGQAPMYIKSQNLLVGTSKGGIAVGLDASTGARKWFRTLGDSGTFSKGYSLFGSCTNGRVMCSGLFWYSKRQGWVECMNVADGQRLGWTWTTTEGGVYGPLTCTQNHVFVPLFDSKGSLVVLDIAQGRERARFETGQTLFSGPAIVNGVMYLGTGYNANGGRPNNKLYAVRVCPQ